MDKYLNSYQVQSQYIHCPNQNRGLEVSEKQMKQM